MFHEHIHHLCNISSMQVIMVGDILVVPISNGDQEVDQLIIVELDCRCRDLLQVLHDLVNDKRESVLSFERSVHLQTVEVKRIDLIQSINVFVELTIYFLMARPFGNDGGFAFKRKTHRAG